MGKDPLVIHNHFDVLNEITEEEEEIVNDRVSNAELPPTTIAEVQNEFNRFYSQHGHKFRTAEDCGYFSMLPGSRAQKELLLKRVQEIASEERKKNL